MTVFVRLTIIPAMVVVLGNQHAVAYTVEGGLGKGRYPSANVSNHKRKTLATYLESLVRCESFHAFLRPHHVV